jgi:hypothetical protein
MSPFGRLEAGHRSRRVFVSVFVSRSSPAGRFFGSTDAMIKCFGRVNAAAGRGSLDAMSSSGLNVNGTWKPMHQRLCISQRTVSSRWFSQSGPAGRYSPPACLQENGAFPGRDGGIGEAMDWSISCPTKACQGQHREGKEGRGKVVLAGGSYTTCNIAQGGTSRRCPSSGTRTSAPMVTARLSLT